MTETIEKKPRKKRSPNKTLEQKAQSEALKTKIAQIRTDLGLKGKRGRIPNDKKEAWEKALKEATE